MSNAQSTAGASKPAIADSVIRHALLAIDTIEGYHHFTPGQDGYEGIQVIRRFIKSVSELAISDLPHDAISRIRAWLRDFGGDSTRPFIADLEAVLKENEKWRARYAAESAVSLDAPETWISQAKEAVAYLRGRPGAGVILTDWDRHINGLLHFIDHCRPLAPDAVGLTSEVASLKAEIERIDALNKEADNRREKAEAANAKYVNFVSRLATLITGEENDPAVRFSAKGLDALSVRIENLKNANKAPDDLVREWVEAACDVITKMSVNSAGTVRWTLGGFLKEFRAAMLPEPAFELPPPGTVFKLRHAWGEQIYSRFPSGRIFDQNGTEYTDQSKKWRSELVLLVAVAGPDGWVETTR